MWDKLSDIEKFLSMVVVMGSIVDIVQFSWIVKRAYKKMRERMYDKIRAELVLNKIYLEQPTVSPFIGDLYDNEQNTKREGLGIQQENEKESRGTSTKASTRRER